MTFFDYMDIEIMGCGAMLETSDTDRDLAFELVHVTEAAAIAASEWRGLTNNFGAGATRVEAMYKARDIVSMIEDRDVRRAAPRAFSH